MRISQHELGTAIGKDGDLGAPGGVLQRSAFLIPDPRLWEERRLKVGTRIPPGFWGPEQLEDTVNAQTHIQVASSPPSDQIHGFTRLDLSTAGTVQLRSSSFGLGNECEAVNQLNTQTAFARMGEDKKATISRWVGELFAYRKCQTALNSVHEYNGGIVGLRAAHGRMLMFCIAES